MRAGPAGPTRTGGGDPMGDAKGFLADETGAIDHLADALANQAGPRLSIELGTLVASLSAMTEDETELDLAIAAVVTSPRARVTIGPFEPVLEPFGN